MTEGARGHGHARPRLTESVLDQKVQPMVIR